MPVLLFRLNGVPEDEAEEVRALLHTHGIAFYETNAGPFGISVAAIWLRSDAQAAQARALLTEYQQARGARMRAEHAEQRRRGEHDTLAARALRHPLRTLLYAVAVAGVLYLSLVPFVRFV